MFTYGKSNYKYAFLYNLYAVLTQKFTERHLHYKSYLYLYTHSKSYPE